MRQSGAYAEEHYDTCGTKALTAREKYSVHIGQIMTETAGENVKTL